MSCISASFRCDNEPDCFDASDEQFCLNTNIPDCPEGEFRCGSSSTNHGAALGSRCILNRFRCDGKDIKCFIFNENFSYKFISHEFHIFLSSQVRLIAMVRV